MRVLLTLEPPGCPIWRKESVRRHFGWTVSSAAGQSVIQMLTMTTVNRLVRGLVKYCTVEAPEFMVAQFSWIFWLPLTQEWTSSTNCEKQNYFIHFYTSISTKICPHEPKKKPDHPKFAYMNLNYSTVCTVTNTNYLLVPFSCIYYYAILVWLTYSTNVHLFTNKKLGIFFL